jgi:hypothetical protein
MGKINGGFARYVDFAGGAFEVKVDQMLLHVSFRMAGDYVD